MKKIFLIIIFINSLFGFNCNKKLFTLKIENPIILKDILKDISSECNLNIILKDKKSAKMLNSYVEFINIKNASLKELLYILFNSKNLFYSLKGNILTVSYYKTKTFKIDFIPNTITGTGNLDSSTNNLQTSYSFDFWSDLSNNLNNILSSVDNSRTRNIVTISNAISKKNDNNITGINNAANMEVTKQNITSDSSAVVIDKNAGLVTIRGTKQQLDLISKYLNTLKERLRKEVLIDVHIYSVELSSSHKTGIDWSNFSISLPNVSKPLRGRYIGGSESVFNSSLFNIGGFVKFLSTQGDVNSISNPKIVTLNSQKAILSIGDTIYYKYASSVTTANQIPTTSYTIDSKFVGVVLAITPQISDNGEIILSINPQISSFKNPLQLQNPTRDMPPDTKDDTLMSVVKLKNNETLVLGGLISNDSQFNVNGVPVLKEIPIIKYLFSSKEKMTSRKELVFVITPHIINFKTKTTIKNYGFGKIPSLEDLNVR